MNTDTKRSKLLPLLTILFIVFSFTLVASITIKRKRITIESARASANLSSRTFTLQELSKYNGDDPSLPIYLAMDGYVYDITAGKKFYEPGGSYHDLAGKDSTAELNIAGGGIIKSKYPIVGRLVQ